MVQAFSSIVESLPLLASADTGTQLDTASTCSTVASESRLVSDKYDDSHANLWSVRESCDHRFPGFSGRRLWDVMLEHYIVGKQHFKFYRKESTRGQDNLIRLLYRCWLNDRDEDDTRDAYKEIMVEKGFIDAVRSSVALIDFDDKKHPDEYKILGGAHCIEAICELYEDEETADNEQVKSSIVAGVDAFLFRKGTPVDVQQAAVTLLNEISGPGSGLNLQQVFNSRQRLQIRWEQHKDAKALSVSKCGGQSGYELCWKDWLTASKCKIFAGRWDFFQATQTFRNEVEDKGRWGQFQELLKHVRNRGVEVELETMVRNMAEVDKQLRKHFDTSMPKPRYELFWWEAIKCCLPLSKAYPGHLMMFDKHGKRMDEVIALVGTVMGRGKQIAVRLPKQKKKKSTAPKRTAKEKKADRENKENKANQAETPAAEEIIAQDQHVLKDLEWGDDCSWLLDQASNMLTAFGQNVDAEFPQCTSLAFRKGLHCVWGNGSPPVSYTLNDKEMQCKSWAALKKLIVKDVASICRSRVGELKEAHTALKRDESDCDAPNVDELDIRVLDLRDFVAELRHPSPLHVKDLYRHGLDACFDACRNAGSKEVEVSAMQLTDVVNAAVSIVDNFFKRDWHQLVSLFIDYCDELEGWMKLSSQDQEETPKPAVFAKNAEMAACFQRHGNDTSVDIDTDLVFKLSQVRGELSFTLLRDLTEGSSHSAGWSWSDLGAEAACLTGVRTTPTTTTTNATTAK